MHQSHSPVLPRRQRRRIQTKALSTAGLLFVLTIMALLFLTPLVWLVSTSLKTLPELGEFPVSLFPASPQWRNYFSALTMINYGQFAANTFFLAAIYTILTTITCALVGFAFARLQGKWKQQWFLIMLFTMLIPPVLTQIPTYILYARVNLIDTYWPWVLWGLSSAPFLSFLFRQFFSAIPVELEEAALLDGCSYLRIFWQIFMPLSGPAIATVAIFAFTSVWGDYIAPSLLLSADNTTLAVAMSTGYRDAHDMILTNVLAAGTVIYILPIVILFFVAQRAFVRGIATSGLK